MKYYCNPLNLPYRYQRHFRDGKFITCREAADPSIILFRGKYYLFPSMTDGFFVSENLTEWAFRPFLGPMVSYDYAPDVCEVEGKLVVCASSNQGVCSFYVTSDPENEPFTVIPGTFHFWDPHLYYEDGRLYLYWGCSNCNPIYGVELDPITFVPLGEPLALMAENRAQNGFERCGYDHCCGDRDAPYIEGAWLNKHDGKYYLQYAAPGTEVNVYADGVYVGDTPLGPFTFQKNNPFSYSPGGFVTGAGHGSTAEDKEGRLWHVATTQISVTHPFERRLGLWRAGYDEDGELYCDQRLGDWPRRIDADPFSDPDWMLLSYGKRVTASSGETAAAVADENCRTWWSADPSDPSPVVTMDLGAICDVRAVQINLMDHGLSIPFTEEERVSHGALDDRVFSYEAHVTRWLLEGSSDGENYHILTDKRVATTDLPHDTLYYEGQSIRYLRLTVTELPFGQSAKVSGLRVFGLCPGEKPGVATASAVRTEPRDMTVSWSAVGADGACILWGCAPDKLYHAFTTFKGEQFIGALVKDVPVYVRVDTFNSHGITKGEVFEVTGAERT